MASMPAPRAAARTWTRAKCQKSPGYSLIGSKLPSTRARSEAERSPAPKMMASSRSLARAISAALDRPSASSISTSSPIRLVRPSLVSSWVRRTSTHQTSRADCALGTMSTSSDSRAPVTTSMMSPWHHGVSRPLTRTARTVRPQSSPVSAATAMPRAASLATRRAGVLEVEEDEVGAGAGRLLAHPLAAGRRGQLGTSGAGLSHGLLQERRGQMTPAARRAARRSGSTPSRSPKTASLSAPRARPRWVDPARRLGQDGDRRLHGHGAEVGIVDLDEGSPGPQVLVGQELLGVVDRRRGHRGRLEDRHGLVERVRPDPVGHQLVDLERPLLAGDRVDVVGILGQVGAVDGPVDPGGDVRRRAGDGQPLVVRGAVGVAGGAGVEAVAHPGRRPSPAGRRRGVDDSMRRASGSMRLTSTSCPPPPWTSRWYRAIITA